MTSSTSEIATLVDDAQARATLIELMQGFSIECTPREARVIHSFRQLLAAGTHVYITALEGFTKADTVATAIRLQQDGMRPVPHIAARRIKDANELDDYLARLTGEAHVEEALVIAGNASQPAGAFHSTLQILETGLLEKHGIRCVGVAGHPEGSPDINEQALAEAILAKNRYAQEHGDDFHFVTQFVFDAAPLIHWEQQIRLLGNQLPVHIGLHGLANIGSLIKHALRCGIGPSIGVLKQQSHNLLKLASLKAPDQVLLAVARQKAADPEALFSGCHFFPLGSFARTAQWANAIANGQFEMTQDGLAVTV